MSPLIRAFVFSEAHKASEVATAAPTGTIDQLVTRLRCCGIGASGEVAGGPRQTTSLPSLDAERYSFAEFASKPFSRPRLQPGLSSTMAPADNSTSLFLPARGRRMVCSGSPAPQGLAASVDSNSHIFAISHLLSTVRPHAPGGAHQKGPVRFSQGSGLSSPSGRLWMLADGWRSFSYSLRSARV
jgi:hypothetical protein